MKLIPVGVWGGYPKANAATSSFLLEKDGFTCLIDCGSGVLASLQNHIGLMDLDAVVITHYHFDHVADIGPLQFGMLIQNKIQQQTKTLPIYGHTKDENGFESLKFMEYTVGVPVEANNTQQIGPWLVSFCETKHPVYCMALKFESDDFSIVFTADTEWHQPLVEFAKGATVLVSESNLYDKHAGKIPGHMSGKQAGNLAKQAGAEQLILTHLPHHGDLDELVIEAKQYFSGPVTLAELGVGFHF